MRANAKTWRDKLLRIELAYNPAHSRGRYMETYEEEKARVAHEERPERRGRRESREDLMKRKALARYILIKEKRFHWNGVKAREACMKRRERRRTRGHGVWGGRQGQGSTVSLRYSRAPPRKRDSAD